MLGRRAQTESLDPYQEYVLTPANLPFPELVCAYHRANARRLVAVNAIAQTK
jgi:hypothetical protein